MGGDALRAGSILLSKYRVESVLGEGGMGVVVSARHLTLDERVAIKFLLPTAIDDPTIVTRFLQEARAAVRIRSEHVARVFDVGNLETGEPYMIMEHLDGSDLGHQVETHGPLPLEQAIDCIVQACEALAEAHVLGIIHRDIKPSNLFLTRRADGSPLVKVLDFGISKATLAGADTSGFSLTHSSTAMGTPLYMSPEQMRSARLVDVRSDVWSLGTTLFELLTGQAPFTGENLTALCAAILTSDPPSLRALRPDVPAEVEAVVFRCLEKSPERRYQNVGELALALAVAGSESSQLLARRIGSIVGLRPSSLPSVPLSGRGSLLPVQAPPASVVPAPNVHSTFSGDTTVAVPLAASASRRPVWPIAAAVSLLGMGALGWSLRSPASPPTVGLTASATTVVASSPPSPTPLASTSEPRVAQPPSVPVASLPPVVSVLSLPVTGAGSARRASPASSASPPAALSSPPATPPTPATKASKVPDIGY